MSTTLLLTGSPGCGKTTLIQRVVDRLRSPAGGFYTVEMRESGVRRGFKMVTLDGAEGVLAHVTLPGPPRVGRYGVDLAALKTVGVASIERALAAGALVVIDEIGPMELFSDVFCRVVLTALHGDGVVLGTVVKRRVAFADRVKAQADVEVIEVRPDNRDELVEALLARLRATGRCEVD
jgi:nucleoside-triphosphatase